MDEMQSLNESQRAHFEKNKHSTKEEHIKGMSENKLRHQKEIAKIEKESNQIRRTNASLEQTNNKLRSEILTQKIHFEKTLSEYESQKQESCALETKKELHILQESINTINTQRKEEKYKYENIQNEIIIEKNKFEEWLKEEQTHKNKIMKENKELQLNVTKLSNIIEQKKTQIESYDMSLKDINKQIHTLNKEHSATLKRVLNEHQRQIKMIETSMREKEKRLIVSEHRKNTLHLQIQQMHERNNTHTQTIHSVMTQLQQMIPNNNNNNNMDTVTDTETDDTYTNTNEYSNIHKNNFKRKETKKRKGKGKGKKISIDRDDFEETIEFDL